MKLSIVPRSQNFTHFSFDVCLLEATKVDDKRQSRPVSGGMSPPPALTPWAGQLEAVVKKQTRLDSLKAPKQDVDADLESYSYSYPINSGAS